MDSPAEKGSVCLTLTRDEFFLLRNGFIHAYQERLDHSAILRDSDFPCRFKSLKKKLRIAQISRNWHWLGGRQTKLPFPFVPRKQK